MHHGSVFTCFYAPVFLRVFTCFYVLLFLRVCGTGLLKTPWKKEKLLLTSNFSFSHSLSYPSEELSPTLIKFEIVVCKIFLFGKSLKFVVWERVKPPLARVWFIYLKANIREQGQKEHMFFGRFSEVK